MEPGGDIVWMCAPRWDSDAMFSTLIALLADAATAGLLERAGPGVARLAAADGRPPAG
jgi:hypothetical protein